MKRSLLLTLIIPFILVCQSGAQGTVVSERARNGHQVSDTLGAGMNEKASAASTQAYDTDKQGNEKPARRYRLYPVPVRTDLYADGTSEVTMAEVYDITGNKRISMRCDGEPTVHMSVSQLARGIYFIKFTTPTGIVMQRFVKE